MTNQFIRKCSLIIYKNTAIGAASPSGGGTGQPGSPLVVSAASPASAQNGIDLSQFRIQFSVAAMDTDAPPTARIRVFNLAKSTVQKIQNEFQNVTLQAGYQNGNFGVIFQGSIVRVRAGRLPNAVDSFVDIMASNWDAYYNFAMVSATLKAGANPQAVVDAVQSGVNNTPVATDKALQGNPNALAAQFKFGYIPDSFKSGGTLPRGKVMFGLARQYITRLAESQNCVWSIGPDGKVNITKKDGVLPGKAVVLTSQTGMIGVPEATQQGIEVKSLLNPLVQCGTQLKIDNASITTTANKAMLGYPSIGSLAFFANTNADGNYRAIVVEHAGDTRSPADEGWVTSITALSLDPSSGKVQNYGWKGTAPSG